ncbi:MAG: hypothetical protein EPN20_11975 [Magnetospirillum sp.]|nr:MAG: hypothetical protein EPN20_11975 [Magnetospirillum sp.]
MTQNQVQVRALQGAYRDIAFATTEAAERYAAERARMTARLVAANIRESEIDTLFEALERMPDPSFGAISSRSVGNDPARRLYDLAARNGVPREEWDAFVATLKERRQREEMADRVSGRLYAVGGRYAVDGSREETEDLLKLRRIVIDSARQMNPHVEVRVLHSLVEDVERIGDSRFDPLKRVLEVALDPARMHPEREAFRALWGSIEDLLGEKEREVIDRHFGKSHRQAHAIGRLSTDPDAPVVAENERMSAAAGAFASYMNPDRRRQQGIKVGVGSYQADLPAALKPAADFFVRVGNAARGLGFQTVEDVYRRAASGAVAGRRAPGSADGVRLPPASDGKEAQGLVRASVLRMSDVELALAIRKTRRSVDEMRIRRKDIWRRLAVYNPAVRGMKKVVSWFGTEGRDALKADEREMRSLMRGLALLEAEKARRGREAVAGISTGQGYTPMGPDNPRQGRFGMFHLIEGGALAPERYQPARNGMAMELSLNPGAGMPSVALGAVRTADAAELVADAFERMAGGGRASIEARKIAYEANQEGMQDNRDIDLIRRSGFLDPDLDRAIGGRDVLAYVYPLKTGDVLFQAEDGRWRAGTMEEFLGYAARSPDRHLQAAAEVVELSVRTGPGVPAAPSVRSADREGAPIPPPVAPPESRPGGSLDTAPREPPPPSGATEGSDWVQGAPRADARGSLASGGGERRLSDLVSQQILPAARIAAEPGRVFKSDPASSIQDARGALKAEPDDRLSAIYKETKLALDQLEPGRAKDRVELSAGLTAVKAEMKARGLEVEDIGKTKPKRNKGLEM